VPANDARRAGIDTSPLTIKRQGASKLVLVVTRQPRAHVNLDQLARKSNHVRDRLVLLWSNDSLMYF
jgi:ribosome maturation factor RimP